MLSESVTQEDLQQARVLQAALGDVMADLAARIGGAYVERGALAMVGSRVFWTEIKIGIERFRLFIMLLDAGDAPLFGSNARLAAKFRRARAQIFLTEVRCLRAEIAHIFRSRLDRIADSGKWPPNWPFFSKPPSLMRPLPCHSMDDCLTGTCRSALDWCAAKALFIDTSVSSLSL